MFVIEQTRRLARDSSPNLSEGKVGRALRASREARPYA